MIAVSHIKKYFTNANHGAGVLSYLTSLFHREYQTVKAVDDISFEIKPCEFVGFIGPNGAGKTTTLKMLSGILHPTEGSVRVAGHIPWKREPSFQKKFSLVMGQKNQLWWDLPVNESFSFNQAVYEIPNDRFQRQKNLLIELLDIAHVVSTPVRKLSLGERMKCELAAALLHEPEILFLDEPTIGMDVVSQQKIREFLTTYNTVHRATIILTSHYMEDIRRLCNRVIIIDRGKILYDGTYAQLTTQYAPNKTIEIVMQRPIEEAKLREVGTLVSYTPQRAEILVSRTAITSATQKLMHFPIDDISIHEETMEEIVRDIFKR